MSRSFCFPTFSNLILETRTGSFLITIHSPEYVIGKILTSINVAIISLSNILARVQNHISICFVHLLLAVKSTSWRTVTSAFVLTNVTELLQLYLTYLTYNFASENFIQIHIIRSPCLQFSANSVKLSHSIHVNCRNIQNNLDLR